MDKELRTEANRMIAELFVSVGSVYTHSDDAAKMRRAAEMLQSLLSEIDRLEWTYGQVVERFSTPGHHGNPGDVGSKPTLPALSGCKPPVDSQPHKLEVEGSIPSAATNRRTNGRKRVPDGC